MSENIKVHLLKGLKGGKNALERRASSIRALLPKKSKHPDAIRAIEALGKALEAKTEAKAWYWMCDAIAFAKDFGLYEFATHGEKFESGRRKGATSWVGKSLDRQLKVDSKASNIKLWEQLELPDGAEKYEKKFGRYIEFRSGKNNKELKFETFVTHHCVKARKRQNQKIV